jgi:hypothetical protein
MHQVTIRHQIRCNCKTCGPCHGNKEDYYAVAYCGIFGVPLEHGRRSRRGVRTYMRHDCCRKAEI